jgi:hypothetical protein
MDVKDYCCRTEKFHWRDYQRIRYKRARAFDKGIKKDNEKIKAIMWDDINFFMGRVKYRPPRLKFAEFWEGVQKL